MLQALNMLETMDLKAMGYNSAAYIHALYQVMNLAFADRDFYYGDPYFPPQEPLRDCSRRSTPASGPSSSDWDRNDPEIKPGDPYPFEGKTNPYLGYLDAMARAGAGSGRTPLSREEAAEYERSFRTGTTSIEAADKDGLGRLRDPERRLGPLRHRRDDRGRA